MKQGGEGRVSCVVFTLCFLLTPRTKLFWVTELIMSVLVCEGVFFLTLLIGLMLQELSRLPEQSETASAHSHYPTAM